MNHENLSLKLQRALCSTKFQHAELTVFGILDESDMSVMSIDSEQSMPVHCICQLSLKVHLQDRRFHTLVIAKAKCSWPLSAVWTELRILRLSVLCGGISVKLSQIDDHL
jgi:hypothetical protein